MSRQARTVSKTGIYHVMVRGNNKQKIFLSDDDRRYFLRILIDCKEVTGCIIYAYCLMPNHVHFLLRPGEKPLDTIFRKIGTRYAGWFNHKYDRVGHLFQDRFKSENVEDERYFLTVLRYIMQNPVKAGMTTHPRNYRWSSFLDYENGSDCLVDIQYALSIVGSKEELNSFLQTTNRDLVMDVNDLDRLEKEAADKSTMLRISDCKSSSDFKYLDKADQKECILKMLAEGMSMGKISRLTGIPKTTISRMKQ